MPTQFVRLLKQHRRSVQPRHSLRNDTYLIARPPEFDQPELYSQNTYAYISSILIYMHYFEVAPNQIIRPGSDVFTYASNNPLKIGQIVTIEVGKKQLIGVVMRPTNKPEYKTKEILSV